MTIKELKEITKLNAPINGTFVTSKCELKPFNAKDGFFLQCTLTDLTGSLKGIVWDGAEVVKKWIHNKMVVDITGEITRYNDMPQVIIKTIKQKKDYNSADFLPSLPADKIQSMVRDLNEWGDNIENEVCKAIWKMVIPVPTDKGYEYLGDISKKFIQCPGGVGEVHHNYLGGLLEHVYGMVRTAMTLSEYAGLDEDILITGCLLHDIGKIDSYKWDVILEMSDKGRLLHHTSIGYGTLLEMTKDFSSVLLMMQNKFGIRRIQMERDFINYDADDTVLKLAHIIVSHHEDGIHKPMSPEANAVSTIDAMDACVQHAKMFIAKPENQDTDNNWTRFCPLTERQYFVPKKVSEDIPKPEVKKGKIIEDSMF